MPTVSCIDCERPREVAPLTAWMIATGRMTGRCRACGYNAQQSATRTERDRARDAVKRALRDGVLQRGPCEQAGPDCRSRIEAHHDDYSQPLVVRWLCAAHHHRLHQLGRTRTGRVLKPAQ